MITQSQLKKLLHYDPKSGLFTWKFRHPSQFKKEFISKTWNARFSGRPAGHSHHKHGYLIIHLEKRLYRAHRLAWLYVHGGMPEFIDHIDGDKLNNAISNLRSVTLSENQQNRRIGKNTKNGIFGVRFDSRHNRYYSRITVNGREIYLGCFSDLFSACCARKSAENRFNFHKNHGSKQ